MQDEIRESERRRFRFGKSYEVVRTILLSALLFVAVLFAAFALPNDFWRFIPHATDWTALFASMATFGIIIVIALSLMWKNSPPVGFVVTMLRILITLAFCLEVVFVGVVATFGNHGSVF
jgi:hypothetical protein